MPHHMSYTFHIKCLLQDCLFSSVLQWRCHSLALSHDRLVLWIISDIEAMIIRINGNGSFKNFWILCQILTWINTLRPRRNGQHFTNDTFKCIFFNENVWISIIISLTFVPKGPIYNIPTLVQIMAWRRPVDKPLSEAMMDSLPTHICVTRHQWVKQFNHLIHICLPIQDSTINIQDNAFINTCGQHY